MGQKKTAGAVLTKVSGYEKLLDITSYDSRGNNRSIHLHYCSIFCLSDCFRAVVEETQVDSILD